MRRVVAVRLSCFSLRSPERPVAAVRDASTQWRLRFDRCPCGRYQRVNRIRWFTIVQRGEGGPTPDLRRRRPWSLSADCECSLRPRCVPADSLGIGPWNRSCTTTGRPHAASRTAFPRSGRSTVASQPDRQLPEVLRIRLQFAWPYLLCTVVLDQRVETPIVPMGPRPTRPSATLRAATFRPPRRSRQARAIQSDA
jgi:hypothetical protein